MLGEPALSIRQVYELGIKIISNYSHFRTFLELKY